MAQDKPELSSESLLREAREVFAPPKLDAPPDGPTIQDLLARPHPLVDDPDEDGAQSAWKFTSSSDLLSSESLLPQRSVDHWAATPTIDEAAPPEAPAPPESPSTVTPISPAPPWSDLPLPPPRVARPASRPTGQPVRRPGPRPVSAPAPGPITAPQPGRQRKFPWRYLFIGGFIVLAIVGALTNEGTTSSDRLDVGDCFENPGTGNFTSVKNQDCAGPHDIQIFAEVKVNGAESFTVAVDACEEELFTLLSSNPPAIFPEDTLINVISDSQSFGPRTLSCTLESPSGALVGSVLGE